MLSCLNFHQTNRVLLGINCNADVEIVWSVFFFVFNSILCFHSKGPEQFDLSVFDVFFSFSFWLTFYHGLLVWVVSLSNFKYVSKVKCVHPRFHHFAYNVFLCLILFLLAFLLKGQPYGVRLTQNIWLSGNRSERAPWFAASGAQPFPRRLGDRSQHACGEPRRDSTQVGCESRWVSGEPASVPKKKKFKSQNNKHTCFTKQFSLNQFKAVFTWFIDFFWSGNHQRCQNVKVI